MLRFLIALGGSSVLGIVLWLYYSTIAFSSTHFMASFQASSGASTPVEAHQQHAHSEHHHHHHQGHAHHAPNHSHNHPHQKDFECGTDVLLARLYKQQPRLLQNAIQQEQLWQRQVQAGQQFNATGGVHTIPVVVHLVHNNGPANLTNPQVQSAIQYSMTTLIFG